MVMGSAPEDRAMACVSFFYSYILRIDITYLHIHIYGKHCVIEYEYNDLKQIRDKQRIINSLIVTIV